MKKLLSFLFALVLMSCEVKVQPNQVKANTLFSTEYRGGIVSFNSYIKNGMEYGVFYSSQQTIQSGNWVAVVNLTKDALEVELLKLEIAKLKK